MAKRAKRLDLDLTAECTECRQPIIFGSIVSSVAVGPTGNVVYRLDRIVTHDFAGHAIADLPTLLAETFGRALMDGLRRAWNYTDD